MSKKTPEQISYNMRQVKSKDSEIELILRKELWSRGLRYKKNDRDVFGKPDIVFMSKKIAVFVDSEFWHGYDWDAQLLDAWEEKMRYIMRLLHFVKSIN